MFDQSWKAIRISHCPLTLFGGRFGKDENTPFDEFINDDGISHKVEGGLKINFTYEMQEDNTCKITAKIA